MLSKNILISYLLISLLSIYLINGMISIKSNSMTYDEMDHWSYGKRVLKGQPQKVYTYDDASAMPISGLNAIPRAIEQLLNLRLSKTDGGLSDVMHGRYVTLLLCMLIGIYVYIWSTELFGRLGGLFSLFLVVFCPNINAHVTLLSTDAYTVLLTLTTFYYFYKFINNSNWRYFLFFSISFAIAQVTKYSLLHLFLIFGLLSLLILIRRRTLLANWRRNFLRLGLLLFTTIIVINIAYLFNGTGRPLAAYEFRSSAFQSIQHFAIINKLPLPLPVPYIEGIDVTYHMTELGPGNRLAAAMNYLNGEYRTNGGFWNYYLMVILYKTPIPYLLLFLLLIIMGLKNLRRISVNSAEFIAGFGILYYFIFFSFFLSIQSGNRHIIFIYPLLYVISGRLMTVSRNMKHRIVVLRILAVYTLMSFYFYFPNLISYTNELIIDKKNAYRIMADTNLDYGQGSYALQKYLNRHTDVKMATETPQEGKIIIDLNDFVDLYGTNKYTWLKIYKPVDHIDHCYLLFNIPVRK